MTVEKYISCYQFCLEQGWVHNTPIEDVVLEYFHSENGRKILFEKHLTEILKQKSNEIHILIGEAPPYYPNKVYPLDPNRKYFYNPTHSPATDYFREPYKHFIGNTITKFKKDKKQCYLNQLAQKGVLILDIFPFPVFQSTDIRDKIKRGHPKDEDDVATYHLKRNSSNLFTKYLNDFFEPRLNCLLDKFKRKKVNIKIYLFAPKYTSVQFLHWVQNKPEYIKRLVKFDSLSFESSSRKQKQFLNKSLNTFISDLSNDKIGNEFFKKCLEQVPIFMNGSGNPDFKRFVNGNKL